MGKSIPTLPSCRGESILHEAQIAVLVKALKAGPGTRNKTLWPLAALLPHVQEFPNEFFSNFNTLLRADVEGSTSYGLNEKVLTFLAGTCIPEIYKSYLEPQTISFFAAIFCLSVLSCTCLTTDGR